MEFSTEIVYTQGGYALCFCGNPMVINLTMSVNEFPANSSARMVYVEVTVGGKAHPFKMETSNGETSSFDISEAWRSAYAERNRLTTPTSAQYEVLEGYVRAYVSYIPEGDLYEVVGSSVLLYEHIFALRGGVSEMDIYLNNWTTPDAAVDAFRTKLSRKPSGNECFSEGDKHMVSALDLTNVGLVMNGTGKLYVKTTITQLDSNETLPSNVIIDEYNKRQLILFENSFGVIESISCIMNEECLMKIKRTSTSTNGSTGYFPDFGSISSLSTDRMTWKMSSGYRDVKWRKWFISEFMTARRHWFVTDNGIAVPVEVSGEESLKIYNAAKAELLDVEFTATAVLNGML